MGGLDQRYLTQFFNVINLAPKPVHHAAADLVQIRPQLRETPVREHYID